MPWRKKLGDAMADLQVTPELVAQVKAVLDEIVKQRPNATPADRMDIAVAFLIKESLERKREMKELRDVAEGAINMISELAVAIYEGESQGIAKTKDVLKRHGKLSNRER